MVTGKVQDSTGAICDEQFGICLKDSDPLDTKWFSGHVYQSSQETSDLPKMIGKFMCVTDQDKVKGKLFDSFSES